MPLRPPTLRTKFNQYLSDFPEYLCLILFFQLYKDMKGQKTTFEIFLHMFNTMLIGQKAQKMTFGPSSTIITNKIARYGL